MPQGDLAIAVFEAMGTAVGRAVIGTDRCLAM